MNLLGGRVTSQHFFSVIFSELQEIFDLNKILSEGTLPGVLNSISPRDDLRDYVFLYLNEEIKSEAMVRNLVGFEEFLKLAALSIGEQVSYSSFANDAQVSSPTIKEYFQILDDTMIGYLVQPFRYTTKRKAVTSSKFYYFDNGVTNALLNRFSIVEGTSDFGKLLEQYIYQELRAYCSLCRKNHEINYWRTKTKEEIDFILHDNKKDIIAIEVRSGKHPRSQELKAFFKFEEELPLKKKIVVSTTPYSYAEDEIEVLNVSDFLTMLWSGKIF